MNGEPFDRGALSPVDRAALHSIWGRGFLNAGFWLLTIRRRCPQTGSNILLILIISVSFSGEASAMVSKIRRSTKALN